MGTFEDKYNDVLRSMEIALVQAYREEEEMTDWETLTAVNGLIRMYTAVEHRRQPPKLKMTALAQRSFTELKLVCDGWLGQTPIFDEAGKMQELGDDALSVAEVIACLKRIRKSVEMWQKEGGRRGYFEFVDQFLP
jgi:hypothetical protein